MGDEESVVVGRVGVEPGSTSHLMKQNLETLDVTKLTPLTPEVISRQATINIGSWVVKIPLFSHSFLNPLFLCTGTIGHVAHGKSTVVKAISGVQVCHFLGTYSLSALLGREVRVMA